MIQSIKNQFTYNALMVLSILPLAYLCFILFYEYLIDSGIGTYINGSEYYGPDFYQSFLIYGIIPFLFLLEVLLVIYKPRNGLINRKYPAFVFGLNLILTCLYVFL